VRTTPAGAESVGRAETFEEAAALPKQRADAMRVESGTIARRRMRKLLPRGFLGFMALVS
jgi:hypothetical protein